MPSDFFDGCDNDVATFAFSAAGVLEAVCGESWAEVFDAQTAGNVLSDEVRDGTGLKWMIPDLTRAARRGVTADVLSEVWLETMRVAQASASRLLLVPHAGAWSPSELNALPEAIARLSTHLQQEAWYDLSREHIGSISVAAFPAARPWQWSWPLRLSVRPSHAEINEAMSVFGRGLAILQPNKFAFGDVAIHAADKAGSLARSGSGGLFLNFGAEGASTFGPAELVKASSSDVLPSAWITLPFAEDCNDFVQAFVYAMSHNRPADLALNEAWNVSSRVGLPPILIAPFEGHFERMDASKLERRVAEFARGLRLSRFPQAPIDLQGVQLYAFDIDPDTPRSIEELGAEIEERLAQGRVRFDNESDTGEGILRLRKAVEDQVPTTRGDGDYLGSAPATERAATAPAAAAPYDDDEEPADVPVSETERFLDVGLLRGHYFAGDTAKSTDRIAQTEAFQAHGSYTLEVAVRAEQEGLLQQVRKLVRFPRRKKETIRIYAHIKAVGRGAPTMEDRLLPLEWPYNEDTPPAYFRMKVGDEPPSRECIFEIRLLSADLQPIDHVEMRFDAGSETGGWIIERATQVPPPIARLDETAANALLLTVSRTGDFEIDATIKRAGKEPLVVPFQRMLLDHDIEALLTDLRDFWTELVIGKMAKREVLSSGGFAEANKELGAFGARAWRALFGDRVGGGAGTSEALGQMLNDEPLPKGSAIRVSLARNAESFVFPWAIVSDPQASIGSLWGLDHEIEISRPAGKLPDPQEEMVRISTTIDPGFGDIVDHAATLSDVAWPRARLRAAKTTDEIYDALGETEPADIYYYFCHGVSAQNAQGLDRTALKSLQDSVDDIPDDKARRPWTLFLDRLSHARGGARMFTGASEITEHDLRNVRFFKSQAKPLVFLNMCHSADLMPGMSSGLARVFLDREAGAVIGTECPVTAQFADAFAREMLDQLLDGKRLGEALLEARRGFHESRNPLALLYTVYGSANLRVRQSAP